MDKPGEGIDEEEAMQQVDETGNVPLSSFSLSAPTQAAMVEMGISHLFPIQVRTYSHINKGRDVIGRARTGCGKTLAFVLPLVERILASGRELLRGRSPVVVCLAPTRELARQVAEVFEKAAPGLSTTCVYGGASYGMQESAMRRGIDIVVGTPGRTIDHIDRGTLRLDSIRFIVLDEADRMLDMGCAAATPLWPPWRIALTLHPCACLPLPRFQEDMEKVFKAVTQSSKGGPGATRQTLLFSATVPSWVKEVSRKYMSKDTVTVDLVENEDMQASTDVKHMVLRCGWQQRNSIIGDLVSMCVAGRARRTPLVPALTSLLLVPGTAATSCPSCSARPSASATSWPWTKT